MPELLTQEPYRAASWPASNRNGGRLHSGTVAGFTSGWSPSIRRRCGGWQHPMRPEVRERLRALAGERRRFGYRRLGVLLEAGGHNAAEPQEAVPALRRGGAGGAPARGRPKRAIGTREPMRGNARGRRTHRWSPGLRLRTASPMVANSAISGSSTTSVASVSCSSPDTSISGRRVVRELDRSDRRCAAPRADVTDNGPR